MSDEVKPETTPVETAPAAEAPPAEQKTEQKKDAAPVEKAAETKPAETQDKPAEYKLVLPEGSLLTASHVEKIVADAKQRGLSQEDAQAELERKNLERSEYLSETKVEIEKNREKWLNEFMTDKTIGGDHAKENAEIVKRYVEKNLSPELRTVLDQTAYGNHPELIKLVLQAAKNTGNDTSVMGSTGSLSQKKSPADILYGSTSKQAEKN